MNFLTCKVPVSKLLISTKSENFFFSDVKKNTAKSNEFCPYSITCCLLYKKKKVYMMLINVWGNVNEIVCFDRVFAWTNGLIFLVYSQILLLQRDFLSNKMNSRNLANDRLRPHIFIYYIYGRFRDFVPTFLSRLTSLSSNLLKNSAVQYYFTAIQ